MGGWDGSSQLLPVLQGVAENLGALEIARLEVTSQHLSNALGTLRPTVLGQRGQNPGWTWQKAHSVLSAALYDPLNELQSWTPGPYDRSDRNVMEVREDAVWLSGGTDWQGFQGAFRCVSDEGVQASWVAFRVRIATPEVSGAFLALYALKRNWGFTGPVLVFNYRGAEVKDDHCFSLRTEFGQAGHEKRHVSQRFETSEDRPFDISVHLDWSQKTASMFVDGVPQVTGVPFQGTDPIRYATLYNWRSGARTAFSDLTIGNNCPSAAVHKAERALRPRTMCPCRRKYPAEHLNSSLVGGLLVAIVAVALAVAYQ